MQRRRWRQLQLGETLDVDLDLELRALVGRSRAAHILLDTDLNVIAATPSVTDLTGVDSAAEDFLQRALSAEDHALVAEHARTVIASGGVKQWLHGGGGRRVVFRLQSLIERGANRRSLVLSLVALNPSEELSEELRASRRRFRRRIADLEAVLELTPVGIVVSEETDGQAITMNASASEILGISNAEQLQAQPTAVPMIARRDGRRLALDDWLRRRRRRVPPGRTEDLRIERPNGGGAVDVMAAVAPLNDEAGNRRGLIVTLADLSEQKQLQRQAELRARQQEAIAVLGMYALTEPRVDRVMRRICSQLARILNVEYCKVLRLLPDSDELLVQEGVGWREGVVGRMLERMDHDSEAAYVLSVNEPVITADHSKESRYAMPMLLAEHRIVSSASVVVAGAGGPYGVLGVHSATPRAFTAEDVAVLQAVANVLSAALLREHLEQELRDSRERLAKAQTEEQMQRAARLASLGTLAAGIAHEINNPLNSVLMNAELGLMASRAEDERVRQLFQRIIDDCKRTAKITDGVLMFARSDRKSRYDKVDLNAVARRSKELVASILHLSGLRIDLELARNMPKIDANETELEQVLINLITNAGEAGASVVTVRTRRHNGDLELSVADNGPGIAEADLPRLFDPFFSTRRDKGGTGLGLSLVHRIVTDHGGTIAAGNREEGGGEFVIHLPLLRKKK